MSKELPVHEGNPLNRDFIAMTIPLLVMAVYFYGPRVLLLAAVALLTAKICDRLAALLRNRPYDKTENSSVTVALLLVLMMPASVRIRVVVAAVLVAVLVGKEAFGGYNSYPFNPAAVGFCVVTASWPEELLSYPRPQAWAQQLGQLPFAQQWARLNYTDATLVQGPSFTLRAGGLPNIDTGSLLFGNYAGPMGVTAALVIVACAVFLLLRKRISPAATLSFLGVVAVITFLFPRYSAISWQTWPGDILTRLAALKYELLSGALVFAAVFLVNEPGTLPKNTASRVIYGTLLGFATVMFRYFGTFELGVCFAFLLVNAVSGYFDRALEGRRLKKNKEVANP